MDRQGQTYLPIAQLNPSLETAHRSIRGIVSLVWPYSSSKQAASILLVEPDFRLRKVRGQVRITFLGHSAREVARSHLTSGDDVVLSLLGAKWEDNTEATLTPGRGVEWELHFKNRVVFEIIRPGNPPINIDVDRSSQSPDPISAEVSLLESLVEDKNPVLQTARKHFAIASNTWASPAFLKRTHNETLSGLPSGLFDDEDDESVDTPSNKRMKFGKSAGQWRYTDRTPSPEKDAHPNETLEILEENVVPKSVLSDGEADIDLIRPDLRGQGLIPRPDEELVVPARDEQSTYEASALSQFATVDRSEKVNFGRLIPSQDTHREGNFETTFGPSPHLSREALQQSSLNSTSEQQDDWNVDHSRTEISISPGVSSALTREIGQEEDAEKPDDQNGPRSDHNARLISDDLDDSVPVVLDGVPFGDADFYQELATAEKGAEGQNERSLLELRTASFRASQHFVNTEGPDISSIPNAIANGLHEHDASHVAAEVSKVTHNPGETSVLQKQVLADDGEAEFEGDDLEENALPPVIKHYDDKMDLSFEDDEMDDIRPESSEVAETTLNSKDNEVGPDEALPTSVEVEKSQPEVIELGSSTEESDVESSEEGSLASGAEDRADALEAVESHYFDDDASEDEAESSDSNVSADPSGDESESARPPLVEEIEVSGSEASSTGLHAGYESDEVREQLQIQDHDESPEMETSDANKAREVARTPSNDHLHAGQSHGKIVLVEDEGEEEDEEDEGEEGDGEEESEDEDDEDDDDDDEEDEEEDEEMEEVEGAEEAEAEAANEDEEEEQDLDKDVVLRNDYKSLTKNKDTNGLAGGLLNGKSIHLDPEFQEAREAQELDNEMSEDASEDQEGSELALEAEEAATRIESDESMKDGESSEEDGNRAFDVGEQESDKASTEERDLVELDDNGLSSSNQQENTISNSRTRAEEKISQRSQATDDLDPEMVKSSDAIQSLNSLSNNEAETPETPLHRNLATELQIPASVNFDKYPPTPEPSGKQATSIGTPAPGLDDVNAVPVNVHAEDSSAVTDLPTPVATQTSPDAQHMIAPEIIASDPSVPEANQALPIEAVHVSRETQSKGELKRESKGHNKRSSLSQSTDRTEIPPSRSLRSAKAKNTDQVCKDQAVAETTALVPPVDEVKRNVHTRSQASVDKTDGKRPDPSAAPEKPLEWASGGFRTRSSYFTTLASSLEHFNTVIDLFTIVLGSTNPTQAKSGPRHMFQTLYVTDPSSIGSSAAISTAQLFRPFKSALPSVNSGDVVLLRNLKVQSRKQKTELISLDDSAWVVFREGEEPKIAGPPVEFAEEEEVIAKKLQQWWVGIDQDTKTKLEATTTTSVASAEKAQAPRTPAASRRSARNIAAQKDTENADTEPIEHELRDGTTYIDKVDDPVEATSSPPDKRSAQKADTRGRRKSLRNKPSTQETDDVERPEISPVKHELRDGTVYTDTPKAVKHDLRERKVYTEK